MNFIPPRAKSLFAFSTVVLLVAASFVVALDRATVATGSDFQGREDLPSREIPVVEIEGGAVSGAENFAEPTPEPLAVLTEFSMTVNSGWRLVSLPLVPESAALPTALTDQGGDTTWNRVMGYSSPDLANHWHQYNTAWPASFNDLTAIDNTMGLWLNTVTPGDSVLRVRGYTPSSSNPISLKAGWNLVGYPCLQSKTVSVALASVPYIAVECYDGATTYRVKTMVPTDTMGPGNGYWIQVSADCVWNIGDTTDPTFAGLVSATDAGIGGAIDLTWNAASDPSGPITYNIYRAATPGGENFATPTYTATATTYRATGLTNGVPYYFVVRAMDSAGNDDANTIERFATPTSPDLTGPIVSGVSATPNPIVEGGTLTLTASVSDATTGNSNVAAAEWSRGASAAAAGSGTAMSASDTAFNSPTEGVTATMSTTGWTIGSNTLWVRGRDAANNWGSAVSTTVTVNAADTVPPQVSSNTPANGATGVAITANVVVVFTEAMNQANTQGAFSIAPGVAGTFSWNAGGDTMTFNPTGDLAYSTLYTVTILTAATDLAGNTLDGDKDGTMEGDNKDKWVFSFTTGAAPDTTNPTIITTNPASGATGVAISQSVIITFSETINTGSFAYTCAPNPGGWSAAWSTVTYTNDRVTMTHTSFAYGTSYTFTVTAASDLAGNALVAGSAPNPWSFTTQANPDATGPIVSGVSATPNPVALGATLTLTAIVSDATTGNNNVAAAEWSRGASAAAAGSGTAMSASDTAFNSPTEGVTASISTTGWTEGANTLWVRGRDVVGNWGNAVSTSVTVTVPDTTPPQVQSNTPANGATGVAVTANIIVDFNEAMNQANTQGAFSTVPSVAGAFSWNAGGDIMTFNPTADLAASTTYTVTILTAATDLAGNTLDGDKDGTMEGDNKDKWVFSFTTAGSASVSRYAVCVGINKYDYQNDLTYCVNDANECRTNLLGAGYSVNLLTDGQATKVAILAALNTMGSNEVAGDYTAFTYSGHGGTSGGIYFICPEDCYYIEDMITDDEMDAIFDTYQSVHQLLFFDSCNSGGLSLGQTGRLHIMAAAANQYSWDGQSDIANGVWTYYFWEYGYRLGNAGSTVLETVFAYAKPLATTYVDVNYGYTMTPQISDGYTGSFYL